MLKLDDIRRVSPVFHIHHLRSWAQFFTAILDGSKTYELRRNDRNFKVNDMLILSECLPVPLADQLTGRWIRALITHITSESLPCAESGNSLHPEFCILGIKVIDSGVNSPVGPNTVQESREQV